MANRRRTTYSATQLLELRPPPAHTSHPWFEIHRHDALTDPAYSGYYPSGNSFTVVHQRGTVQAVCLETGIQHVAGGALNEGSAEE